MVTNAGLYFPYIHFRDDNWVKASALYWPAMARIVPARYPTQDSDVVQALADESDFVIDLPPTGAAQEKTARLFLDLLERYGQILADHLSLHPSNRAQRPSNVTGESGLGFIYAEKMAPALRDRLLSSGLAVIGEEGRRSPHRPSMDADPSHWIGLDERLAGVYMCVLSEELARRNALTPITDQPNAQLAAGGWSVERMAEILTGADLDAGETVSANQSHTDRASAIAQLALSVVLPKDLGSVPVERIVRFRERHSTEMEAFQAAVRDAVEDLQDIGEDVDDQVLARYLQDVVSQRLAAPQDELRRALKLVNSESILSTLSVQASVPALATLGSAGVAINPVIGAVAGAAVGVATVAARHVDRRRNARKAAPAAAYLLSVKRDLSPARGLGGALARLQRR